MPRRSAVTERDASAMVPEPSFRDLLAIRDFRGIWLSQLTSIVGDQLAKLALAVLIFHRTNNALLAALVFAVSFLPALIAGPACGVLVDTLPRRRILLGCDSARVVLVAIMCVPGCSSWALLGILFVVSALESPFASARTAMLPDLLPAGAYPSAQSISALTDQIGQIAGFAAGGAVVGSLSARGALAFDAGTFLISAMCIAVFVRAVPSATRVGAGSYWRESAEGARVVVRTPLLRRLTMITAVGVTFLIFAEVLAVAYAASAGGGSADAGFLAASAPIGSAIGITAVRRYVKPPRRLHTLRLLAVIWPLPLIATVLQPPIAVTCVLWGTASALAAFTVLASIMFMEAVDPAVRGRAYAFVRALVIALQGLGALLAGALADAVGAADAVTIGGIAALVICPFYAQALRSPPRHRGENGSSYVLLRRLKSMAATSAETREQSPPLKASARVAAQAPVRAAFSRPSWREFTAASISIFVIVACAIVVSRNLVPDTSAMRPIHLPWWALTLAFLAVDVFGVPFQQGRSTTVVFLSELPLVLGLFLSSPREIFWASFVAFSVASVRRWRGFVKFIAARASAAIFTVGASGLFAVLRPGEGTGWWDLLAALAATLAADIFTFFFIVVGIIEILGEGRGQWPQKIKMLGFTLVTGTVGATVGLLAIAAMWTQASYGFLLVIVGFMIIVGSQAYAELQERHKDLRQLYTFQDQLRPLTPRFDDLASVLEATRALLNATSVELKLAGELAVDADSSVRRVLSSHIDRPVAESWQPDVVEREPDPTKRISVPLYAAGQLLGTLTAFDRLGSFRGFRGADLQLLETLSVQVSDALEKGELLEQLRDAASHDALTGLLTLAELSRAVDEHLLGGEPLLVALLDVARLKDVNDSLGHEAGDALLKVVAAKLSDFVPADAFLARSGGGEFAIVISGLDVAAASAVIDDFAERVSGLVQVLDVTIDLRTRIGWAHAPLHGNSAGVLIRRADLALAAAKKGLQRSAMYMAELEVDGMRRIRLVNDLRHAIEAREIDVVYQPLVTPCDGRVIGAEALARWTHRQLGPLGPDEFIILAEQSGLIGSLTELVLDKALAQTAAWASAGHDLRIAINLSARCLSDLGIPALVLDLLTKHRVSPSKVTLEVTETSVAEDPAHAELVLERLRGLGVRLSIDDFGTGYSSLASLKRFPVQEVKLDRQFVIDLEAGMIENISYPAAERSVDEALVSAIVSLAHSLGLEMVAEGVETESAYTKLRDLGVDVLQGYFIGRPMSSAALLATIQNDENSPTRGLALGSVQKI
jgi:diguanylate cyclase (GGDEF)-like protein